MDSGSAPSGASRNDIESRFPDAAGSADADRNAEIDRLKRAGVAAPATAIGFAELERFLDPYSVRDREAILASG
jgi:hypothetical protein